MKRRLVAILAMDMIGFSRLVELNEEETLRRQRMHRKEVVDPLVREAGGRIVKTTGDGMLVEFASSVVAVSCAISLQERLSALEAANTSDTRIRYRIGINVGDVIFDEDDIYGDGVNIAARLEPLADPGGICISASVWDQIAGNLAREFSDAGKRELKNISRPIQVYAWRGAQSVTVEGPATRRQGRKPTLALADFAGVGQNAESTQLAEACRHSVIAALANLTGIEVLDDPEKADHVASAQFHVIADRYRALVTLHDRLASTSYETAQFQGRLEDPFATQDELSGQISNAIRYAILEREADKIDPKALDGSDAETLLTRAAQLMMGSNRQEWQESASLVDSVLKVNPDHFMALAMKANSLIYEVICGWRRVDIADAEAAESFIRKAQKIKAQSDFLYFVVCYYNIGVKFDVATARRAAERCLELSPQYTLGLATHGFVQILMGEIDAGFHQCERALVSLTRNRIYHRVLNHIALGHFVSANDELAVEFAQRALQQESDFAPAMLTLASAAARLGDKDMSRSALNDLRAAHPDLRLRKLRPLPFKTAAAWEVYVHHLEAAGVPA